MLDSWSRWLRSAVGTLIGYGLSVALMAVFSLAVIKAMVAADGAAANLTIEILLCGHEEFRIVVAGE